MLPIDEKSGAPLPSSASSFTVVDINASNNAEKGTKNTEMRGQDSTSGEFRSEKQIFEQPGTMPLPDSGYHSLGICFEDLTVLGAGATSRTVESTDRSLLQIWNVPNFIMKLLNIKTGPTRELISNFSGVVPAGETLLVLGRPGAGCSTLLRALSNQRAPFVKITGQIQYSSISSDEAYKYGAGEIVFNSEEDNHEPTLTVAQTMGVAFSLKKPKHLETPMRRSDYASDQTNRAVNMFGMPHVLSTQVGNDYLRGVSGGERKRVSLSEMFATNAAIICWDNCIRGLDSAIALHYLRCLKEMSRSTGMTNIVSIYQASEEVYETCFDRVCVIYEGKMIFFGPASEAAPYFVQQGWYKKARQTIPDFLTACTSVRERRIRDDYEGPEVPLTPDEMAAYFIASPEYAKLKLEIAAYKAQEAASDHADQFRLAVKKSKHDATGKPNPYKVNFAQQTAVLVRRQLQLVIATPGDFIIRLASNALQAVVVGSIFYKPPSDALGSYAKAGALFFTVLYFAVFSLSEIPPTVMGRPLLIKHRTLGFYNPAAKIIAEMLIDSIVYAVQTLAFASIFYFLLGFNTGAKYFFTFWFVIYTSYMNLSVMYRMVASWAPDLSVAIRYGGLTLSFILGSGGFLAAPPQQLGWTKWMSRISPVAYAFEALIANEFRTETLTCSASSLVPNGPTYNDLAYQGCTIVGAIPGSDSVSGTTFMWVKYGFSAGHIWRNVGILWAMYVIYAIMVIVGSIVMIRDTGSSSSKLYKAGGKISATSTEHTTAADAPEASEDGDAQAETRKGSVFSFKDVCFTVQVGGKKKLLLDHVTGIVEPGRLTALMGASGAGKTTLLNTISLRQTTGHVEGEMRLDGKSLDPSFSRRAGFAQQGDVHDPYSTVRECLQFSALLRQTGPHTRAEKLAYAEEVIELLELGSIADALIGNAEIGGLGVEERKRVTIGVELAARPDSLLFLDEPTSGLDSQAAYQICHFLRKIAAKSGLPICCVIHQPSGDLFEMFDSILLLAPGGKTCYAGPTGLDSSAVSAYFGKYGAAPDPGANPAEHLIATVAPVGGSDIDWPQRWRDSQEAAALTKRVEELELHAASNLTNDDNVLQPHSTADIGGKFATGYFQQVSELLKRNLRTQYRDGSYWTTKIVMCCFYALFTAFYVYKFPHSPLGVQTLTVALLVVSQICAVVSFSTACYYQEKFGMYLARERLGIYSWQALVTALLIVEIPINLICYTVMFLSYFWTAGLNSTAVVGGINWLAWAVFAIYSSTFGVMLGSFSPSTFAIGFVLSFLWNVVNALSWALVPWSAMPEPYHTFFTWLSPLRWFFGVIMESTLSKLDLTCGLGEFTVFNIPDGTTCGAYAASFLSSAASLGYLSNPEATESCSYCQWSSGSDYMAQLGYSYDNMWRDWGILIVHCCSNIMVAFLFTWLIRIRPLYKK